MWREQVGGDILRLCRGDESKEWKVCAAMILCIRDTLYPFSWLDMFLLELAMTMQWLMI